MYVGKKQKNSHQHLVTTKCMKGGKKKMLLTPIRKNLYEGRKFQQVVDTLR